MKHRLTNYTNQLTNPQYALTPNQPTNQRRTAHKLTTVIKEPPHVNSPALFAPEVGGIGRIVHGIGFGQNASQDRRGSFHPQVLAALLCAVSSCLLRRRCLPHRALASTGSLVAHHPFVIVLVVITIIDVVMLEVVPAVDDSAAMVPPEVFESDAVVEGGRGVWFLGEDGADFA